MHQALLALRLELLSGAPRPTGAVVLANMSGADMRVWRTGNSWGDTVLSFEVRLADNAWRVVRLPQVYSRNVPSSVVVSAGATHAWPFDLGDGQWEADVPLDRLFVPGALLLAIYEVPPSPEAIKYGVWTGQLQSNGVVIEESRPGARGQTDRSAPQD